MAGGSASRHSFGSGPQSVDSLEFGGVDNGDLVNSVKTLGCGASRSFLLDPATLPVRTGALAPAVTSENPPAFIFRHIRGQRLFGVLLHSGSSQLVSRGHFTSSRPRPHLSERVFNMATDSFSPPWEPAEDSSKSINRDIKRKKKLA